jgi:hypothetical protein
MGEGSLRNKKCICGSGKKFKHCCESRKLITRTVMIENDVPTRVTGVEVSAGGDVKFLSPGGIIRPKRAWSQTFRQRKKADKVLVQIPTDVEKLKIGDEESLLGFDHALAVDTNNRSTDRGVISVSHVMQLKIDKENKPVTGTLGSLGCFEFHGVNEHQENLAWLLLMNSIAARPSYSAEERYALITDSDLGNHNAYNAREKAYFGDKKLRENFTLVYASEEGRGVSNVMIRTADKLSRETLKEIVSDKHGPAPEVEGEIFTRIRVFWNNNEDFLKGGWLNLPPPSFKFKATAAKPERPSPHPSG